ncbi:hypothetical protein AGMMS49579_22180 [Spirochaetia bacterium]|nr:hypothetical protein AGMMS49579_22180 [Spirochaetia bacterium]
MPPISTRKATEVEAFKVAFQWLQEGVPKKQETVQVKQLSLKSLVRGISTEREAETVLKELKRMGFLKAYILVGTDKALGLIEFLSGFWDWKHSPYVQEKLRKKHSLHETHCLQMARAIEQHWKPYFNGRFLGEITRQDLNAFIDSIGGLDCSAPWKNMIIRAGTIALKWAYNRDMIDRDVSARIIWFSGDPKERQILSSEQAAAVFRVFLERRTDPACESARGSYGITLRGNQSPAGSGRGAGLPVYPLFLQPHRRAKDHKEQ